MPKYEHVHNIMYIRTCVGTPSLSRNHHHLRVGMPIDSRRPQIVDSSDLACKVLVCEYIILCM